MVHGLDVDHGLVRRFVEQTEQFWVGCNPLREACHRLVAGRHDVHREGPTCRRLLEVGKSHAVGKPGLVGEHMQPRGVEACDGA